MDNWDVNEKIQVLHNGTSLKPRFKFNHNKNIKIGYFGSIYKSRGIEMILKLCKLNKENDYISMGEQRKRLKI